MPGAYWEDVSNTQGLHKTISSINVNKLCQKACNLQKLTLYVRGDNTLHGACFENSWKLALESSFQQ